MWMIIAFVLSALGIAGWIDYRRKKKGFRSSVKNVENPGEQKNYHYEGTFRD